MSERSSEITAPPETVAGVYKSMYREAESERDRFQIGLDRLLSDVQTYLEGGKGDGPLCYEARGAMQYVEKRLCELLHRAQL